MLPAFGVLAARGVLRAHVHARVDQIGLAGAHARLPALERFGEIGRALDRPFGLDAVASRDGRDVEVRLDHLLSDELVRDRAVAYHRHPFLMGDVIVVGAVVGDDDQQGDFHVRRGPERVRGHGVVAIADHPEHEPAGALERERGSDAIARPRAHAAA